jgi:predicted amino acid dehydrogenase
MPAAKKSTARTTRTATRATAGAITPSAATRRQLEQATKRLDKALDDAGAALQALGQDLGHGAQRAYKDLDKALKVLRRDAQKTNRALLKDLEKLAKAVTPAKAPARPAARTRPARRAVSGAAAKKESSPRRSA